MIEEIEASLVEAYNLVFETFQLTKRRNWWSKLDVGDEVTKNIKSPKNILGLLMAEEKRKED